MIWRKQWYNLYMNKLILWFMTIMTLRNDATYNVLIQQGVSDNILKY